MIDVKVEKPAPLISPSLMFRFRVPCLATDDQWDPETGITLGEQYRIPCFAELDGLTADGPRDQRLFGDLRLAWNEQGLYFDLRVNGKQMEPTGSPFSPDNSDGIQIFIDTRDSKDVRRANRFCHRFHFGPETSRSSLTAQQYAVQRAKEHAPRPQGRLHVRHEDRIDGYLLQGGIPAKLLNGFDPEEHPRLGFSYLLRDREFGLQPFSVGWSYRFLEDPSLWGSLELTRP